ncbi:hypothetical protein [Sorangium sp. So ce145]|uniref:hypothetical protein n=1 Tax=Sorangium sp. So ce145 TaxID=3133285 RepID=UPI003F5DEE28
MLTLRQFMALQTGRLFPPWRLNECSDVRPLSFGRLLGLDVSLKAKDWFFYYGNMPNSPKALASGVGWYFDFPRDVDGPHYLYTTHAKPITANNLTMTLQVVITSGSPTFDPADTTVRPYIQREGDNWTGTGEYQFYRWWSNPIAFRLEWWSNSDPQLRIGITNLIVPLKPDHWSSVLGRRGDEDASTLAGFQSALKNVQKVGMTFGGGGSFGHGVTVSGGTVRFILTDYSVY